MRTGESEASSSRFLTDESTVGVARRLAGFQGGLKKGSRQRYHLSMHSTHRKTLALVFSDPVPRSMEWHRIESLLLVARQMLEMLGVTP